ncbi:MAG: PASTA domain-containing protein [candidate division Zixibacteria bacterium]|nr:PASTA domain-containing protein [candidate division Zixibacteria bacterium]
MMMLPKPKKSLFKRIFLSRLTPSNRTGRFLLNYIGIPLVVLFLAYVMLNDFFMLIITRHGSEFILPNIINIKDESAREILKASGLEMEITSQEYRPDRPEGTILSQYPEAGTRVKSGRTIKVALSIDEKSVVVPQLGGFSMRQAKLSIEAAGLIMGEVSWTYSDSLPESVVVFSYPTSGVEVMAGAPVNLVVNRGRLESVVYMPMLVGKTLSEARAMIEALGLKIGRVTRVRNENYLPETILEQSVDETIEIKPGEEIDLKVSTID